MKISAIIFDMDGTLTNNLGCANHAYRESFKHYTGRTWSDDELHELFGPNCEGICQAAVGEEWQEAVEMFYRIFDETYDAASAMVPGMVRLLEQTRAEGYRTAIVSGGSPRSLEISLKHLGIGDYFGRIVGGSAQGAHKPESIREVLGELGVPKEEAIYVGDSTYDMRSAIEVGLIPIRAAWTEARVLFKESPDGPQPAQTFESVTDFGSWLKARS